MATLTPSDRNALGYALNDPALLSKLLNILEPLQDVTPGEVSRGKAIIADSTGAVKRLQLGTTGGQELLVPTFTISPSGTDTCKVVITLTSADSQYVTAGMRAVLVWLSGSSNGMGLAAMAPSGGLSTGTNGRILAELVTSKLVLGTCFVLQNVFGFDLLITDTAKTAYYVAALPLGWGVPRVSRALTSDDYG